LLFVSQSRSARVKYGSIITEIKGKVGGTVFQGGRSGGVMKNLGSNIKRELITPSGEPIGNKKQNEINLSIVTKAWSSLTEGERNTWSNLLGVWTFTDKFGNVYNGTAFQIFTACNLNRLYLDLPILNTAPIEQTATDQGITVTDYSVSGVWDVTVANNPAVIQTGVIRIAAAQNATKNLGSVILNKAVVAPSIIAGTVNIKALYTALYNEEPPLNSAIYTEIWYCIPNYPRKQFAQTYKSFVVA
jgi:hypothetical protein